MSSASVSPLLTLSHPVLSAGILYHDMYASDLVGTHVEMRSLEVSQLGYIMLGQHHLVQF